MAEDAIQAMDDEAVEALDDEMPTESPRSWASIWQLPVFILGLGLLILGVYVSLPAPEHDEWPQVLDEVQLYLKAGNFEESKLRLEAVEEKISRAAPEFRARYRLLWGDLVFLEQRAKGWDSAENHARINKYYGQASELGYVFDPVHAERWAETLVSLDRYEDAMVKIVALGQEEHRRRLKLMKTIIARKRKLGTPAEQVFPLITQFLKELDQETELAFIRQEQLWASKLKAEMLLNINSRDAAAQAVQFLIRRLMYFHAQGRTDDLAPLEVLLARAHQAEGALLQAEQYYRQAQQRLKEPHDPLHGRILVGQAEVALAREGDAGTRTIEDALSLFTQAERKYPATPAYLDALIGRAHCEALIGKHTEALEHFTQAVQLTVDDPNRKQRDTLKLVDRLVGHHDAAFERKHYEVALSYLTQVKPLFPQGLDSKMLALFAATHDNIAQEKMAQAEQIADRKVNVDRPTKAREALNREAAKHYEWAGDYYRQFAQRAFAKGELDQYAETSWRAAECYDGAQRWDKSIDTYRDFIARLDAHPKRLDAVHHLGLAFMAQQPEGDYNSARERFEFLLDHHERSPAARASIVPLAWCYMELGRPEDAETKLLYVITDHPEITTDSPHYRDALIALGKLYYRQEQYDKAIVQLEKAVTRYAVTREAPELCYFLADAYRLSVRQIDEKLKEPMPRAKRNSLETERNRRLGEGAKYYGLAIDGKEDQPGFEAFEESMLSAAERLYHRNSYFYQGDCQFLAGNYEQSIALYDRAFKRWEYHPASLIALMQIVNAYCALDRPKDAIAANRKAMWALKRFPEESWRDPSLPMSRAQWEEWLRRTNELNLLQNKSAIATGG